MGGLIAHKGAVADGAARPHEEGVSFDPASVQLYCSAAVDSITLAQWLMQIQHLRKFLEGKDKEGNQRPATKQLMLLPSAADDYRQYIRRKHCAEELHQQYSNEAGGSDDESNDAPDAAPSTKLNAPAQDLSLKSGQTFSIKIGGLAKKDDASSSGAGVASLPLLAPPPRASSSAARVPAPPSNPCSPAAAPAGAGASSRAALPAGAATEALAALSLGVPQPSAAAKEEDWADFSSFDQPV